MSFREGLRKIFNPTPEEKEEYRKKRLKDLKFKLEEEKLLKEIHSAEKYKQTKKKQEGNIWQI